jgi:hypothetical protein
VNGGSELLHNGDFARWDTWRSAPHGWHFWSTAGTGRIRRASPDSPREGELVELEHRTGEGTVLFQDVPDAETHRNENYTFAVSVRASRPGSVSLSVDDGVIPHKSAPNHTSGQWERLSIDNIVSFRATQLRVHVWLRTECVAQVRGATLCAELRRKKAYAPSLDDLVEEVPDEELPPLDRRYVDEGRLTPEQRHWRDHGFLILQRFLPNDLIDAYCRVREKLKDPGGYPSVNPYHEVVEMRDLCLYPPLPRMLESLIGEPMGMSLALTGWISTERNWHQDDLNPPSVNGWYAAVWIALDDIHPDSGPFEFVPGSHRWPIVRRDKLFDFIDPEERTQLSWPKTSEGILVPLLERKIKGSAATTQQFVASKGDVLIWHAHLVHRGSSPRNPRLLRKSLIAHFTSIHRLLDAPQVLEHKGQGYYF